MPELPTTLSHGDLQLRAVDPVNADTVLEAVRASITELHRWQPWAVADYSRTHAISWACHAWLGWQEGTTYNFTIHRGDDAKVLGTVGCNQISGNQANLGYWTRSDAAGQGIATTAARLCARFGFEHVGLRRIHLHHHVGNHGSRRVAEKVGFVREGLHRQVTVLHDEPIDAVFYSLLGTHEISA